MQKLINALEQLDAAFNQLNTEWIDLEASQNVAEVINNTLAEKYPFKADFGELTQDVGQWVTNVKNSLSNVATLTTTSDPFILIIDCSKIEFHHHINHLELRSDIENKNINMATITPQGKISAEPETWAIDNENGESSYLYESEGEYNQDVYILRGEYKEPEPPKSQKLSLNEFRRTMVRMPVSMYNKTIADIETDNHVLCVYADGCYIEEAGENDYYLILENRDWQSNNLSELEEILYNSYYLYI